MTQKEKKNCIKKLIVSAVSIAFLALAGTALFRHLGLHDVTRQEVQDFIASKGAAAPFLYILLSFAQVTLIPIPGAITILAGNYLFGPLKAFIYSYIGMLLGAMTAFFLGKWIGRPFVNWIAGSKEKADEWIGRLKGREKIVMFFMFLLPLFPDDLLCAIAGMLHYTAFEFLIVQLITRTSSIFGTLFFMSGEFIPYNAWGTSLVMILVIAGAVGFYLMLKNYEAIEKKMRAVFRRNKKENGTKLKKEGDESDSSY